MQQPVQIGLSICRLEREPLHSAQPQLFPLRQIARRQFLNHRATLIHKARHRRLAVRLRRVRKMPPVRRDVHTVMEARICQADIPRPVQPAPVQLQLHRMIPTPRQIPDHPRRLVHPQNSSSLESVLRDLHRLTSPEIMPHNIPPARSLALPQKSPSIPQKPQARGLGVHPTLRPLLPVDHPNLPRVRIRRTALQHLLPPVHPMKQQLPPVR